MGSCQWGSHCGSLGRVATDDNLIIERGSTVTVAPPPPLPARVVDGIEDNGRTFLFNMEHSGPKASTTGRPSEGNAKPVLNPALTAP